MELVQLQTLITLLRENGVTSYKDGNLELTLGAAPTPHAEVGGEINTEARLNEVDKALSSLPDKRYAKLFASTAGGAL